MTYRNHKNNQIFTQLRTRLFQVLFRTRSLSIYYEHYRKIQKSLVLHNYRLIITADDQAQMHVYGFYYELISVLRICNQLGNLSVMADGYKILAVD